MCLAHIATLAPSAANPRAAALPRPLLAAHTSATLPASPVSIAFLDLVPSVFCLLTIASSPFWLLASGF